MATVTDEGIITAVSIGSVTIKAVVPGTDISDKCEITVNPKAVTGIECQSNASVLLGETVKTILRLFFENLLTAPRSQVFNPLKI